MSCECSKWLLLAVDEWKAHKEYEDMKEKEKSSDELRHFQDFYERIKARCPEAYRKVLEEITKCEKF